MFLGAAKGREDKMKFLKIVKFVALGIFLLVQVYLFLVKDFEVLDYCPYINEHPLPLFGENKDVSQEFRTPGLLARIDIMMANYKIKPKDGILRLSIYKKGGGTPNPFTVSQMAFFRGLHLKSLFFLQAFTGY